MVRRRREYVLITKKRETNRREFCFRSSLLTGCFIRVINVEALATYTLLRQQARKKDNNNETKKRMKRRLAHGGGIVDFNLNTVDCAFLTLAVL